MHFGNVKTCTAVKCLLNAPVTLLSWHLECVGSGTAHFLNLLSLVGAATVGRDGNLPLAR